MSEQEYFLGRDQIEELGDKLEQVSSGLLELEMATACDGQARIGGSGGVHDAPVSRPPYPIGMQLLIDDLRNELSTTIRHLEESRPGLRYDRGQTVTGMAKWLHQKRFAIALVPEAEDLRHGLVSIINRCLRAVNAAKQEYVISPSRVDAANRQWLTAGQIEKLAHRLGDQARGLNKRRVETLAKRHALPRWQEPDTGVWFYRIGDVLERHRSAPRRHAREREAG